MRSEHKLQVKAYVIEHITEIHVMDCTGMSVDEINAQMNNAYIEGLPQWECIDTETGHSEIDMKLEIVKDD